MQWGGPVWKWLMGAMSSLLCQGVVDVMEIKLYYLPIAPFEVI